MKDMDINYFLSNTIWLQQCITSHLLPVTYTDTVTCTILDKIILKNKLKKIQGKNIFFCLDNSEELKFHYLPTPHVLILMIKI